MLCMFKIANKISMSKKEGRKKRTQHFANSNPMRYILKDCAQATRTSKPNFYPVFGHNGRKK